MARTRILKTSFTAGELAPELLGRPDLRAWANGAQRLRNVFIQPTGGVTRRPGLRHIAILPGPARLIAFEFNTEQTYLLALTDGTMQVFIGDIQVARVTGPWTTAMLPQLAYTQSADTLLLCHPDMPPQKITRTSNTAWSVANWSFTAAPFHRFVSYDANITASATAGTIALTASIPVFQSGHVGVRFRLAGKRVSITGVASATQATATVIDTLTSTNATQDWDEEAFSAVHGWPVTVCFHQDRLVIGGSRDLPNRLWLSRTGDLFNFDLGTGLDDQAIEFGVMSDQVNAIRGVFSGRSLQLFTSGAEWMVSGVPLTPGNIQLNRQTRVGSQVARLVQPVDVDGATIFAARNGRGIFEFDFTALQQMYQATDVAVVSHHLIQDPVAMTYDQRHRLLHIAMLDGSIATLTLYRDEQVTAWSRQETNGIVQSLADIEGVIWAAVLREGSVRLERFDDQLALDAALTGAVSTPTKVWGGLDHLEGATVGILADGASAGTATVLNGKVALDVAASTAQIGLPFTHDIQPLPPDMTSATGVGAAPLRLIAVIFRVIGTSSLAVDLGRGVQPVPFRRLGTQLLDAAPASFIGDIRLRAVGWQRDAMTPLWRITDDTPLPMTLLSVTTEMRMTD